MTNEKAQQLFDLLGLLLKETKDFDIKMQISDLRYGIKMNYKINVNPSYPQPTIDEAVR